MKHEDLQMVKLLVCVVSVLFQACIHFFLFAVVHSCVKRALELG